MASQIVSALDHYNERRSQNMQWLLQDFEDTRKLAEALDELGIPFTWHKVVPFIGELEPAPAITDSSSVVMFGSYTLWRYAHSHGLKPGVFMIRPFVREDAWHPFLLNGADALFMRLRDISQKLPNDPKLWFMRPVEDSKEEPGKVLSNQEVIALAEKVLALDEVEIPQGSLRHDTELMFTKPVRILKEWRLWVVNDEIVTYSLYKEGSRVVYRHELDEDALAFGEQLVNANPSYSPAYVVDICRTDDGLKMLETNCINAAGFYAAELHRLASAIDKMNVPVD
ncbi:MULTISPECIES: ATP-grasp domain-containing protein [unclassified Roseobacter]|uniref:ATP-grasp domain-containing protein n=1 Tax=unclassified Roseobacter TaxID=196798 RepID=UPI00209C65C3|nr:MULTISPECIES: ATP-grasp domain-containing protein [unclassified Roseobacter]